MADDNKSNDETGLEAVFGDFVPGQRDSTDNPMMRAKEMMKAPLPKRFYKVVSIGEDDLDDARHYQVLLDGRPIRSPAKNIVSVPNRDIAAGLAAEWDGRGKRNQSRTYAPYTSDELNHRWS